MHSFKKLLIYVNFYLSGCPGSSLLWLLLLQNIGFRAPRLHSLQHMGSVVMDLRLNCHMVHGILLDQGSNLCLLHWQADRFLTTGPPGKSRNMFFISMCTDAGALGKNEQ